MSKHFVSELEWNIQCKVINLRQLLKSLNDQEIIGFLSDVITEKGKEAILQPLFKQFINNQNIGTLDASIFSANKIIRSRDKSNTDTINQNNLDALPSILIGEVASYLKQNDYASLSKTNRSIYVVVLSRI